MGCVFLVLPQPIEALAESGGWGLFLSVSAMTSSDDDLSLILRPTNKSLA